MSDILNSSNVVIALEHIQKELPDLVDSAEWISFNKSLQDFLERLNCDLDLAEKQSLTISILELAAPHDKLRERLSQEIESVNILRNIGRSDLTTFISTVGLDENQLDLSVDFVLKNIAADLLQGNNSSLTERDVYINSGGKGGGKSVKFQNLYIDFNKMSHLFTRTAVDIFELLGQVNPIIIAAKLWLILREFVSSFSEPISEQDASVFWGLISLPKEGEDKIANEDTIFRKTNLERQKWGFSQPLSYKELEESLIRLEKLKIIEKMPNEKASWRLIERLAV